MVSFLDYSVIKRMVLARLSGNRLFFDIIRLYIMGASPTEIMRRLGVSRAQVYKAVSGVARTNELLKKVLEIVEQLPKGIPRCPFCYMFFSDPRMLSRHILMRHEHEYMEMVRRVINQLGGKHGRGARRGN